MIPKARHYRVVSRNKEALEHNLLSKLQADWPILSLIVFVIWIFGILIGILSHNK